MALAPASHDPCDFGRRQGAGATTPAPPTLCPESTCRPSSRRAESEWLLGNHYISHCRTCVARDAFSRHAEYEWRLSNHYVSHCRTCVARDAFSRHAEYEWRLSNHYVSHCRTCVARDAFSRHAEYEWRLSNHYVSHCRTCLVLDASDGGEKSQHVSVKGIESSCYGVIQRISGSLILFCTVSCLTLRHVDVLCFCVVLKNVAV